MTGLVLLLGCREGSPPAGDLAAGEPTHRYDGVLGVVVELPVEGRPASSLRLHHERIPAFVDPRSGRVETDARGRAGMPSMVMMFPVGEGVDLAGLEVGDPVRFGFGVWTEPSLSYRLLSIEELPAGTAVTFDQP